jgi:hypothetical protein
MVKIAFYSMHLDIRGTSTALFDYAHYNEILLNNDSIIIAQRNHSNNDVLAMEKFEKRFEVFYYDNIEEIQNIVEDCDILYCIKYGKNDHFLPTNAKNVIHCVFDMSDRHGDVYAAVSETLAKKYGQTLFVPHMIGLPPATDKSDNLRRSLNIPDNAIVFGRHGGQDTFDLQFARDIIAKIVNENNNIYFVLVNTPVFYIHPRIIFIEKIITYEEKNRFISTCDAHIECGTLGHTFGLAIGEFSINNKPIITYGEWTWNNAHKEILGNKANYFTNSDDFYNILTTFNPEDYKDKDLNCYKDYTPEKVMEKFRYVFIDGY